MEVLRSPTKQKLRLYPYQYIDKSDFLFNEFCVKVDGKNMLYLSNGLFS